MTATERDLTRLSVTTCADCPTARRSYETTGGAVVCSCGTVYAPEGFVWPTAPVRPVPELPEDSRVQVIRLADVATQTTVRLLRPVEDSELVRVRAVLFELRPDRDGPLGGDVSRPVAVIDRPVVRLAGSGAGERGLREGLRCEVCQHRGNIWHMTAHDLEGTREGQDAILRMERDQLRADLRHGTAPLVCLSAPGEPRRFVRLTREDDLTRKGMPWRNV